MSRDQGRYLLVIVLLVAAAGAVFFITRQQHLGSDGSGYEFVADIDNWQKTDRERAVKSNYDFNLNSDLADLPLQLGDWAGVDVPQTNLEVFILLEPEQYLQRQYRLPDGRSLWLSLIGSSKSKSFHSPQICYDTDGWQTDAGSEPVQLSDGEVYALKLVAKKDFTQSSSVEHVILYFYLWPTYARNQQDGMVLVKLTAPLQGTVDETVELEKSFFRELFQSARS